MVKTQQDQDDQCDILAPLFILGVDMTFRSTSRRQTRQEDHPSAQSAVFSRILKLLGHGLLMGIRPEGKCLGCPDRYRAVSLLALL